MVEQRTVTLSAAASAGQQCPTTRVGQMLAEGSLTPRSTQGLPAHVATPLLPADTQLGLLFMAVGPEAPQLVWLDHKQ